MNSRSTTKLFVGNLKEDCRSSDLRPIFEKYGEVAECDVVKDFAFVHFYNPDDAMAALEGLDGSEFQGLMLRVQMSHSKVRPKPGMGEKETCYKCGKEGHWSKDCRAAPSGRGGPPLRGGYRGGHDDQYYGSPEGRDYYVPASSGGPPLPDRYHPYGRRHAGPMPRTPDYPQTDYAWPADYYSNRTGYPDYNQGTDYNYLGSRDPPETDELGRPPPEYYAHRLKDALYELVKDPKRIPSSSLEESGRRPTSHSTSSQY